ncbi:hypothetical protein [Pseudomonas veronii]
MLSFIFDSDGNHVAVLDEVDIEEFALSINGVVVKMLSEQPSELHEPKPDGTWYIPQEVINNNLLIIESEWRDNEMAQAKDNVTALEYGDDTILGTASQWQKYWLALRKWTDIDPDFPNSTKRPVAPS